MANEAYDAIVVGSGISGGWAAKELTEKGLRVLLLERGPNVEHVKDYKSATLAPWEGVEPRSYLASILSYSGIMCSMSSTWIGGRTKAIPRM